jgi:hypothetical protein
MREKVDQVIWRRKPLSGSPDGTRNGSISLRPFAALLGDIDPSEERGLVEFETMATLLVSGEHATSVAMPITRSATIVRPSSHALLVAVGSP